MLQITSGRLALATSSLALVVAVGGVGYAAATIGTADLKKNAVTSQKIKNDQVTGKDVKESSLAKVPSAASADTATSAASLGGVVVKKVNYQRTAVTPSEVVFSGGGLTLTANCAASGNLTLVATTSVAAFISSFVSTDSDPVNPVEADHEDFDLGVGETFDVLVGTSANVSIISVHYFTRAGDSVVLELVADESSTECWLNGFAVVG